MPRLNDEVDDQFFVKGKISDCDFLHIDQALKPRTCGPFNYCEKWRGTPGVVTLKLIHEI